MIEKYRIESGQFVGQVDVADGVIVDAPNVWKRFIGQKLNALIYWLAKCNGHYQKLRIGEDGKDVTLADVVLPTYCGCNELLENIEQLETHVERGCWRTA